ncbi:hypothetical protein BZA70DRAFT_266976 [Myxozyma melibiosi]|uniref:Telomere replication protein EST3 n=1 Tax=Myxozyma melibiosi TaxID=54550 RepID=A0ABR1F7N6_9ASCO
MPFSSSNSCIRIKDIVNDVDIHPLSVLSSYNSLNSPSPSPIILAQSPAQGPNRKVISHIFGRNKRQTLAIPDSVWVTVCRRHYQRESYRKDKFPLLQTRLVLLQLDKLEAWGHVLNFTVSRTQPKQPRLVRRRSSASSTSSIDDSPPLAPRITPVAADALDRSSSPHAHYLSAYIDSVCSPPSSSSSSSSSSTSTRTTPCALSFAQVRALVHEIELFLLNEEDPALREFPRIEILPNIRGPLLYTRGGRRRVVAAAAAAPPSVATALATTR